MCAGTVHDNVQGVIEEGDEGRETAGEKGFKLKESESK